MKVSKKDTERMKMKELQFGNAIIKLTRPTLSETEQAKRERQLENALQLFGKAMVESEGRKA